MTFMWLPAGQSILDISSLAKCLVIPGNLFISYKCRGCHASALGFSSHNLLQCFCLFSGISFPYQQSTQWIGLRLYQRQHLALAAGHEVLYACHGSVVAGRAWAVLRKRFLLCSAVSHHLEVTVASSLTTDLSEMEASPVIFRYCMLLT